MGEFKMQDLAKQSTVGDAKHEPKHIHIDHQISSLFGAISELESFVNSLDHPTPKDDKNESSVVEAVPVFVQVLDNLPNGLSNCIDRVHKIRHQLTDFLM